MGILGFDAAPFVISIAAALIVGGAIFIYMRARISDLERSHVEQARVLRTFIAQQQQQQQQQQHHQNSLKQYHRKIYQHKTIHHHPS